MNSRTPWEQLFATWKTREKEDEEIDEIYAQGHKPRHRDKSR
jgi:hypothetical protein